MSGSDLVDAINPLKKPEVPDVPKVSDVKKDERKARFKAAKKAAVADKERFGRDEALLLGGDLGDVTTAGRRTSLLGQ